MTAANVASHEKLGGEMSAGELMFCRELRTSLHQVIEGRGDFESLLMELLGDLQEIRKWGLDVDRAVASGWRPTIEIARRAREQSARERLLPVALPSQEERAVLEDMDGLIDYAVRNGVSFDTVFAALVHDVGQIRGHDDAFNLAEAQKNFTFHLRAAGWAKRNAMPVGDPEAETE